MRWLLTIISLFTLAISMSLPAWAFDYRHLKKLKALNKCEWCDLSGAKLVQTAFQECEFSACKMLGIAFEACNSFLFQVYCSQCTLDFSSFYQVDLSSSQFSQCQLKEADFTEANLSGVVLDECNLAGATFDQTNLEKTDFSSAVNYELNPDENKIRGAIFSKEGLAGLLSSYHIKIV